MEGVEEIFRNVKKNMEKTLRFVGPPKVPLAEDPQAGSERPTLGKGIRLDLPVRFCPYRRRLLKALRECLSTLSLSSSSASTDRPTRGNGIKLEALRPRFKGSMGEATVTVHNVSKINYQIQSNMN